MSYIPFEIDCMILLINAQLFKFRLDEHTTDHLINRLLEIKSLPPILK